MKNFTPQKVGARHVHRSEALNGSPLFIEGLANLVADHLKVGCMKSDICLSVSLCLPLFIEALANLVADHL